MKKAKDKLPLDQNIKIKKLAEELESQNEELLQQEWELSTEREKLEEANIIIQQQQNEIIEYDTQMEDRVTQKSLDLIKTNEELVKKNNDLLQFSYTVSHNLRSPITHLLTLGDLFKKETDEHEKEIIADLIYKSTKELNNVIADLSLIIDSSNDNNKLTQKIWESVIEMLGDELSNEYKFSIDFSSAPVIYGSRPMVHSILYNLASNSIKYRSPDRTLNVSLRTGIEFNGDIALYFEDNGLGIDLQKHHNDIFGLHKRFHSHIDGHGVGLYLIKNQMESMKGTITVDSTLDKGTVFTLYFKKHDEVIF